MSQKHIVIIDDDDLVLKMSEMLLANAGFKVTTFSLGLEAIEFLKIHHNVDLVVLDLMMPQISGIDVLKKFRESEDLSKIKVLIQTGINNPSILSKTYALGAIGCIAKPYSKKDFISKIKSAL